MKSADLVVTEKAQKGFYPTPLSLGGRLLAGIDWKMVSSVLEPSAGKGNLLIALADGWLASRGRYDGKVDVDCIEIDPHLRSILLYEFGGQHEEEMCQRMNVLKGKAEWDYRTQSRGQLTPEEIEEKKALENEQDRRRVISFHMIHDDFLTFGSRKRYDLIVMNPPFEDGDVHLLRAIEYQERSGGMVRCILNAETIRNPYTNRRKLLREKLVAIGAEIEFVDGAFSEAERQTDVSVAIIKATIPAPKQDSSIFDRLQKAAHLDEGPVQNVTEMAVTDFLEQIVSRFNVEVDAGLELIREYEAMRPYLLNSFDEEDKYRTPTLTLCAGDPSRHFRGDGPKINEFLQLTRAKYWGALFSNKEFIGKLTSNLRTKYYGMVDALADYDFTLFNIQQIVTQMNAELGQGIEETIVAMFDRMTEKHSWYPEMEKNVHYFNGWKTNKVHKINKKVILPCNGAYSTYSWEKDALCVRGAVSAIEDIEKVFDFLDGQMTAPVDLYWVVERASKAGQTRNIHCKYFDVTFYKKGTMHITFRNQELVDRFNIYCGRKKNWLPPCYGKARYADMSTEERAVVDGFHGDGSDGAGETAYGEVMANAEYYLAEPSRSAPALMAPAT